MTTENRLRDLDELRILLNSAMAAKYGPKLHPGETLLFEVERNEQYVKGGIVLETADASERFEFEAVRLASDQSSNFAGTLDELLDIVIDYLDAGLEFYFEEERFIHHNDDWRKAEYQGQLLRYRSALTRPALDALADAWLAANGDPDAFTDNTGTDGAATDYNTDE